MAPGNAIACQDFLRIFGALLIRHSGKNLAAERLGLGDTPARPSPSESRIAGEPGQANLKPPQAFRHGFSASVPAGSQKGVESSVTEAAQIHNMRVSVKMACGID
jgi:redox-sensitive bicupin YhaK (pirin superfamily)